MGEPGSDSLRLFLALWPGPSVRLRLAAARDQWQWQASAAPVRDERLHLTLHFMGEVPAAAVPGLMDNLVLPHPACELVLDRAAVWRNGCAVLESSRLPPRLASLHQALALALQAQGQAVDARALRPHVTLARHAEGCTPPVDVAPVRWPVRGYVLVRSRLRAPVGYEVLKSY